MCRACGEVNWQLVNERAANFASLTWGDGWEEILTRLFYGKRVSFYYFAINYLNTICSTDSNGQLKIWQSLSENYFVAILLHNVLEESSYTKHHVVPYSAGSCWNSASWGGWAATGWPPLDPPPDLRSDPFFSPEPVSLTKDPFFSPDPVPLIKDVFFAPPSPSTAAAPWEDRPGCGCSSCDVAGGG